ncbi:MAG: ACT domain-containing protein, partial [Patescibacteria group bacterium]|nr:ACT domain-containing protein [Patescibacteria group bacterium]
MNNDLKKIISSSSFILHEGRFIYTKVRIAPPTGKHFLISKDNDEITVVTKEENIGELDLIEKNKDYYSLIELKVSLPFYTVGFLATVSSAIANKGMNILIVSTYSKDYILVREEHEKNAILT